MLGKKFVSLYCQLRLARKYTNKHLNYKDYERDFYCSYQVNQW